MAATAACGNDSRQQSTADQAELGPLAQAGTPRQDVVPLGRDPVEDRQAPAREEVDVNRQGAGHPRDQRPARVEQRAGTLDLECEQGGECRCEPQRPQIIRADIEPLAVLARQVDPADREVAGHVLPEVRQLQPGARQVGEPGVVVVVRPRQVEHQMPDRIGRAGAVVEQLRIGRVLGHRLILLEGRDQAPRTVRSGWRTRRRSRPGRSSPGAAPAPRTSRAARRATTGAIPAHGPGRPPHRPGRRTSGRRHRCSETPAGAGAG